MSKNRDLNRLDKLPASWTDAIQEELSSNAANVKFTTTATQITVPAGTGTGQVTLSVNGLWRYNTSSVTAVHGGGAAGIYDIVAVASANVFAETPSPDTDTTDYSFGIRLLATGVAPTGNHNGAAITAYRKIGEYDWDGSKITGLRKLVDGDTTQPLSAISTSAGVTPIRGRGAGGSGSLLTLGTNAAADNALTVDYLGNANATGNLTVHYGDGFQLTLGNVGGTTPGILFGPSGANLYRSATGTLKVDGFLNVGGNFLAQLGAAQQVQIGNITGAQYAGVAFGIANDTVLYRDGGAGLLRTDGDFRVGTNLTARHGTAGQVRVGLDNTTASLQFGNGSDGNLRRSAANTFSSDMDFQLRTSIGDTYARAILGRGVGPGGEPGLALGPGGSTGGTDATVYRFAADTLVVPLVLRLGTATGAYVGSGGSGTPFFVQPGTESGLVLGATGKTLGFYGSSGIARQAYGVLTYATSRAIDAGSITLPNLANVVATLIDDFTRQGLFTHS